ncbi:hypothetical protein P171DRAFT_493023 [Karstenula rhodostoma CBS 690.94]|uniref:Uncharacterized protein n=1 Tax=Karstenula rhodostoma CBS 690.94 TaxID=1392251 RepID=A0A9P4PUH9_9PLEO|nr:hypothetical protein P171DRAFT_493023 [Karstenula rhodostoma CBS 690.94]
MQSIPCQPSTVPHSKPITNTEAFEFLRVEYATMQSGLARLDQRLDEVHIRSQRTRSGLRTALQNNVELTQEILSAEVDLSLANIRIHDLLYHNDILEKESIHHVAEVATTHERLHTLEFQAHAQADEHACLRRSRANLRETLRLVTKEIDDALEQVTTLEFRMGKKDRDHVFEINRLRRRAKERDVIVEGLRAQIKEYKWRVEEVRRENKVLRKALERKRKRVGNAPGSTKYHIHKATKRSPGKRIDGSPYSCQQILL